MKLYPGSWTPPIPQYRMKHGPKLRGMRKDFPQISPQPAAMCFAAGALSRPTLITVNARNDMDKPQQANKSSEPVPNSHICDFRTSTGVDWNIAAVQTCVPFSTASLKPELES